MKILVDSNVILDVFLMREGSLSDSYRVMQLCSDKIIDGYMAAHTVTSLFYILRKNFTPNERREMIFDLFSVLEVVQVDFKNLLSAVLNFDFTDFEDCVQDECAVAVAADYIVTGNVKDFKTSKTPAVTPEEFIQIFNDKFGE